jgi:hypothetical protein
MTRLTPIFSLLTLMGPSRLASADPAAGSAPAVTVRLRCAPKSCISNLNGAFDCNPRSGFEAIIDVPGKTIVEDETKLTLQVTDGALSWNQEDYLRTTISRNTLEYKREFITRVDGKVLDVIRMNGVCEKVEKKI